ncbi:LysM peptidoglycan-binding domain-containing protein [Bifidobacterium apri]|uniref:LysM peptidoglycan-binding domain-containing protein n=1 Tax=Bifidobacterium apri TaxID=1769423 RepID=UPI00399220F9
MRAQEYVGMGAAGYRAVQTRPGEGVRVCNRRRAARESAISADHSQSLLAKGLIIALLVFAAVFGWSVVESKTAESATPARTVTYTVQAGDTLWRYAQETTPAGGDVNQKIDEIVRLNNLQSTGLKPGETIVVPIE